MPRVVLVQDHEEGRHDQEEDVGGRVDELGDVGGEGVVVLTPVDGTRAPLQVSPHLGSLTRQSSLTTAPTRAWSHRAEHINSTDLWKAFIYRSALESIQIGCSYEIEGRILE